jgi:LysR family hydrogen peroxide-inducible transcriptional activator
MISTPLPLTLRQLQYVVALADTASFRRAAERCLVSQPSLSAQLATLEAALGVKLFDRDRRRVIPTPAGADLIDRARRVLMETEGFLETVRRHQDPLAGVLRLGVIPTLAAYLLPEIDPALRKAFPRLSLTWREDKTEVLVASIRRGELDAAILALEADIGDLAHEVLGQDPFLLAVGQRHRLARGKRPVRLEDLRGERVLLLDEGHCFRDQALEICSRAEAEETSFRATSLATLAQMVAGGDGITLLPRLAVEVENRRGALVVRRFRAPAPYRTVVLVWRRGTALEDALRQVAEIGARAFRSAFE